MVIFARSSPCSPVTQPRQLPASSLTSVTFFSPATPASGDKLSTAATSRARYVFMVSFLLSFLGRLSGELDDLSRPELLRVLSLDDRREPAEEDNQKSTERY